MQLLIDNKQYTIIFNRTRGGILRTWYNLYLTQMFGTFKLEVLFTVVEEDIGL